MLRTLALCTALPFGVAAAVGWTLQRLMHAPAAAREAAGLKCVQQTVSSGLIAVVAAFLTAGISVFGWPGLPPQNGWQWLVYVAPLLAALHWLLALPSMPCGLACGLAAAAGVATLWLMCSRIIDPIGRTDAHTTAVLAAAAITAGAGWFAAASIARCSSPGWSGGLSLAALLISAPLAQLAGFMALAQLACAAAAALAGAWVVGAARDAHDSAALGGFAAALVTAVLGTTYLYNADFMVVPTISFVLLAAGLPAAGISAWLGRRWGSRGSRWIALCGLLATAGTGAVIALWGWLNAGPNY